MKVKAAKQAHYESGPNMTPLVDVVMVILIFLMLAGSFAGSARFIMSKAGVHQKGIGGAAADPNQPVDVDLDVTVRESADTFVASWSGFKGSSDPEAITAALNARRVAHEAINPPDNPKASKLQVVLQPYKNVKYQHLIRVYQAATSAQIKKVAFAPAKDG